MLYHLKMPEILAYTPPNDTIRWIPVKNEGFRFFRYLDFDTFNSKIIGLSIECRSLNKDKDLDFPLIYDHYIKNKFIATNMCLFTIGDSLFIPLLNRDMKEKYAQFIMMEEKEWQRKI
jgi:hypothetical protein